MTGSKTRVHSTDTRGDNFFANPLIFRGVKGGPVIAMNEASGSGSQLDSRPQCGELVQHHIGDIMKKTTRLSALLGLATLAACGLAQAQSMSLTGTVRVGVAHGNGGKSNIFGSGAINGWSVNDETSNVDIDAKKDLDSGLYAAADLQHFFQADTGKNSNFSPDSFFDGRSIVRLGNASGEIYFGHDYTPVFWTGLAVDPWSWDASTTQIGALQWANYASTCGIRTDNTVGIKTASMNGFTFQVAGSPGEGTTGHDAGFNATYSKGPIYASVGYDEHSNIGSSSDHLAMVAASYDLGSVKPGFQFSSSKVGGVSYQSASAMLTAPVGPGTLRSAVGWINDADTAKAGKQAVTKLSVGYLYPLGKEANVFAGLASSKESGLSRTTAGEVGMAYSF